MQGSIVDAVHKRWNSGHDIESRAAILQYLATSSAIKTHLKDFADIVVEGLDDYTTNARGDVGSLVRIAALKVAGSVINSIDQRPETTNSKSEPELGSAEFEKASQVEIINRLYSKTLRLAAEKMDKARVEAQQVVGDALIQ